VVLACYVHSLWSPADLEARTAKSYFKHSFIGVVMLVSGFLLANAIPFFSQLLGLIGGLLAGPINFLLPIGFYVAALGQHLHGSEAQHSGDMSSLAGEALPAVSFQRPAGRKVAELGGGLGVSATRASGESSCSSTERDDAQLFHSRGPQSPCHPSSPAPGSSATDVPYCTELGNSSERDDQELLGYHRPPKSTGVRETHRSGLASALPEMPAPEVIGRRAVESGSASRSGVRAACSTVRLALKSLPIWEVFLMAFIIVVTLMTMVFGVADQLEQIAHLQSRFGAPFSCHALQ